MFRAAGYVDRSQRSRVSMSSHGNREQRQARVERWRLLMRAAQDGDQAAYSQLLSELLPILRNIVRKRWRDQQGVEDIVQDILMSVHSVRHTYDSGRPFLPWLLAISRRRIADAARRMQARAGHEMTIAAIPEGLTDADQKKSSYETSDDQEAIRVALSTLPTGQRRAIELMKLKGLSLEEAAVETGKSVASLKVAVHRAVKAMRQALERKV
jgi:RNA polymerase sigma factor (sigma-70 family)